MTIRWALLGTGRHADGRAAPQLKTAAGSVLAAVLSRDRARGEAFAKKHGIAKVHISMDELLRDRDIDALYDATPDGLHAPNAAAAAAAGKHILIEKPLALSLAEGVASSAACRRHGVKLGVVFQQRHDAVHQEARRLVLAGEIGDVVSALVQLPLAVSSRSAAPQAAPTWRTDPAMRSGGIVMSIGDHAYDTLAYLLGQDIVEVSAFTDATRDNPPDERAGGMLLHLSRGAIGYAYASFRTPYARRPFEIHGTKGSLILTNTYSYLIGAGEDATPSLELVNDKGRTVRHFPPSDCFRLEVEQFNRAIEGKGEPMTTAEDGLRALAITDAIYAAWRGGRVAKVADFMPRS
ncbi:MAG TPA: Gfo/Idh/MocA family oxidoreductase [Stellaceae bacterium]|nr:Gfo/Idh/MocA family oxidoreductase [Stellaceae bacterium]